MIVFPQQVRLRSMPPTAQLRSAPFMANRGAHRLCGNWVLETMCTQVAMSQTRKLQCLASSASLLKPLCLLTSPSFTTFLLMELIRKIQRPFISVRISIIWKSLLAYCHRCKTCWFAVITCVISGKPGVCKTPVWGCLKTTYLLLSKRIQTPPDQNLNLGHTGCFIVVREASTLT